MIKITKVLIVFATILLNFFHEVNTAWLIVPPTSPTRHQLIWGVGIPLPQEYSVTTGYVFKAQYYLADNVDQLYLKSDVWADISNHGEMVQEKRKKRETLGYDPILKQHFEKYFVEVDDITKENEIDTLPLHKNDVIQQLVEKHETLYGNGNEHGLTRWHIYQGLEEVISRQLKGNDGKACLLRMICEFGQTPIGYHSGLIGELIEVLLRPSASLDEISHPLHRAYFSAEAFGKENQPCDRLFHECKISILDFFTGISIK